MIAIFWKELRELGLAALAGLAFAALFGLAIGSKAHHEIATALFVMLGFEGAVLGLWQSFLDRAAAGDEFLVHRPISKTRIHAARSAAGLVVVALVVGATFGVMCWWAWRKGFDLQGNPIPKWDLQPWWQDVTPARAAFAAVFAAATWAVVRLAGASRPLTAVLLLPLLPTAFVMLVGRTPGVDAPAAIVVAAGVVALLLGLANAVDRRPARRS